MRGTGPIKSKWVCLYFFMYWDADAAVLCFGLVPYRTCLWEGALILIYAPSVSYPISCCLEFYITYKLYLCCI